MGYDTSLTDSITIEPPLTHTELADTPWTDFEHDHPAGAFFGRWHAVRLAVTETSTETEQGTVTVRTAAVIEPVEDSYSGNTPDNVQAAVTAIVEAFPGHLFTGHIEGDGESPLDVWRVVARGREVVTVEPTLTWPGEGAQAADAKAAEGRALRVYAETRNDYGNREDGLIASLVDAVNAGHSDSVLAAAVRAVVAVAAREDDER